MTIPVIPLLSIPGLEYGLMSSSCTSISGCDASTLTRWPPPVTKARITSAAVRMSRSRSPAAASLFSRKNALAFSHAMFVFLPLLPFLPEPVLLLYLPDEPIFLSLSFSFVNHRRCQKAPSGIVIGRQGLGQAGLWLVAIANSVSGHYIL